MTSEAPTGTSDPEAATPSEFGQALGFLLSQLGFAVSRRFRGMLATLDLEPRHFALMGAIASCEGQAQHALAARLEIPTSSMVSLVDDLQARGIVERRAHATDRRARTLHLTPKGTSQLAAAGGVAVGLEGVLVDGIPEADRLALVSMLKRVAENLGLTEGVHPNLGRASDEEACGGEP